MSVYGPSTVKRRRSTREQIGALACAITTAIEADKPVTLRGVFYRVVSAGEVEKTENGYRRVGRVLLQMRRAGIVDYGDITDGTRWIVAPRTWSRLDEMLEDAAASYRRDLWHSQAKEVYLFTEKDAISGAISPVTSRWHVPRGVLRGYSSESFAWSVAQHVQAGRQEGKSEVWLYQLGDHDPSGIDAWRAFTDRVMGFLQPKFRHDYRDGTTEAVLDNTFSALFQRLAVTEQQITAWGLPTRPTKRSDTRAAKFDGDSVEVDAIPAPQLRELAEDAITRHIDPEALRLTRIAEQSEREVLSRMIGDTQ